MDDISEHKSNNFGEESNKDNLSVVITDASTDVARALAYRILYDETFGQDQSITINLYDFPEKSLVLESVAIELTSFHPNLLKKINCTNNSAEAFKNADIVFSIGKAKGHIFSTEEYSNSFFKDCVLVSKSHAEAIEKYAKSNVKIITTGNTDAIIISHYAPSIPPKNITAVSLFDLRIAKNHIADKIDCHPNEIRNLIIWCGGGKFSLLDYRFMYFNENLKISNEVEVWIRESLPQILHKSANRCWQIRGLAYALADHCKCLWKGTLENEWICMGVLSNNNYGISRKIFFSYPVICINKEYKIVKNLYIDEYMRKRMMKRSKLLFKEMKAALDICQSN